ncbi:MAG: LysR family transcriptional regulator [Alphaproteobacteria bacterium]|nr:LysR family transcriptional regulator [Alphaproteobacteria bacterium]MBN9591064.1 LysR family transcriptional regulator [Alphaproteobacteria bacterium]
MKVDVNQLLAFVAVADELSYRKAADRLNIAQPWLSRQIAKLEAQLGFQLFARTTRQVKLTLKGQRLLTRARLMAREVDATVSLANILARENPHKLRIGVPFFALYVHERVHLFDAFSDVYPEVKLEICTGDLSQLRIDLMDGDLDGLFSAGPIDEMDLDATTLVEARVEIILPPKDPLAAKSSVALDDVAGRSVTVFPRELNRGLYDQIFGMLTEHTGRFIEVRHFSYTSRLEAYDAISFAPAWSPNSIAGGIKRPIDNCTHTVKFQLLRRRNVHSELFEKFWGMAVRMAKNPQQDVPVAG